MNHNCNDLEQVGGTDQPPAAVPAVPIKLPDLAPAIVGDRQPHERMMVDAAIISRGVQQATLRMLGAERVASGLEEHLAHAVRKSLAQHSIVPDQAAIERVATETIKLWARAALEEHFQDRPVWGG